ncbi:hypothetical protein Daus18300_011676 [Diaporthe australafricana]|uniref:NmrA-like domain-containing protein n=1 Tax=Diaporthe australafricana TaxID=127596 RepID=A0ABR3W5W2_9PEZI
MSTTVAVAGGTRGIGRAIAEAISRKDNIEVKILSRSANPELEVETGISIITVDYSNVDALTKVLVDNKIDTVISTLFVTFDGSGQVNLVKAAEASQYTRRFVPSIWGIPYSRTQVGDIGMDIGKSKLDAVEALQKTSLEYTLFYVGYFLDYWGYPRVKSFQRQNYIAVDIENKRAAIPGTGNTPVAFTHSLDIAEFVAASLDLPKWELESYVIGDIVTWNDLLRIAEDVTGKAFEVTYDDLDTLLAGKITELPSHPSLYSQMPKEQIQALFATFGVWFEKGLFNLQPTIKPLNEVFPNIKVRTVREVIAAGWKQV